MAVQTKSFMIGLALGFAILSEGSTMDHLALIQGNKQVKATPFGAESCSERDELSLLLEMRDPHICFLKMFQGAAATGFVHFDDAAFKTCLKDYSGERASNNKIAAALVKAAGQVCPISDDCLDCFKELMEAISDESCIDDAVKDLADPKMGSCMTKAVPAWTKCSGLGNLWEIVQNPSFTSQVLVPIAHQLEENGDGIFVPDI